MWKMFLPLWPLDNLRVLSHEETSPFLMKCALVLTFFLNDSLWNFPSNQFSKIKGSYFHLDPQAPTLSLRRRACKLERLYPYAGYLSDLVPYCSVTGLRVYSIWLHVCEIFDSMFLRSNICVSTKHAIFYFHLLPAFPGLVWKGHHHYTH